MGYVYTVQLRKALISAMYDKITSLSLKSIATTNSGKLITLISADMFTIERPLSIAPLVFASPFINILCYSLIGFTAGWIYAAITCSLWFIMIVMQYFVTKTQFAIKGREAKKNDERLKLVSDMVTGIRTIKSYAWENHYMGKIISIRRKQLKDVFALNLVGSLGLSVFQNMGLVAVLLIFLPKWYMGEEIREEESFALLAMIYFVFFSVNSFTYMGMTTIQQFLVIVKRLSDIFMMDDFTIDRNEEVEYKDVGIKIENGEYAWGFKATEEEKPKKGEEAKVQVPDAVVSALQNVNLDLASDGLLVVAGKIGAGKTTLLYALMDETDKVGGTTSVRGNVAYVEQEPFIFSSTIKENITFGRKFDQKRFDHAIKVSQLKADMP